MSLTGTDRRVIEGAGRYFGQRAGAVGRKSMFLTPRPERPISFDFLSGFWPSPFVACRKKENAIGKIIDCSLLNLQIYSRLPCWQGLEGRENYHTWVRYGITITIRTNKSPTSEFLIFLLVSRGLKVLQQVCSALRKLNAGATKNEFRLKKFFFCGKRYAQFQINALRLGWGRPETDECEG